MASEKFDEKQIFGVARNIASPEVRAKYETATGLTGQGLTALKGSRCLRRLSLRNIAVSDADLASLSGWPYLESLDLRGTAITDEGLGEIRRHRYLRELKLNNTKVTPEGSKAFCTALPDCPVEY